MSQNTPQDHISKKRVVYTLAGADTVTVRRDVEYPVSDAGSLTMDLYSPTDAKAGARLPAIVVVAGFPDQGFQKIVGCRFKEMGSSVSWGELMAASGLMAITYTNRAPEADLHALLRHLRRHGPSLGIDENRIGLWASSGNVPLALSALMAGNTQRLRCAVLYYGYMLDLNGASGVAEAASMFKFVNASAGKSIDDLPKDVPLFVARAGQDQMPRLNEALDRFVAAALTSNLPLTVVNHPTAPHAFDLLDDRETSRAIVRQTLAFLRLHLAE